jgi:protein TonB
MQPLAANDAPDGEGDGALVYERAVYRPSRRAGPVAFLASAGVILAAMAALATLSVVSQHRTSSRLTVVEMRDLDTTPPPPPKRLEKPVEHAAQSFVPKPLLTVPAPGPVQITLDAPPPPQPAPVAAVKVAPTPAATAAEGPPSATPLEGGDLSSQVISAKPPAYPIESRRHREQGTVKLLVLVGPDGRVADIQVAGSSGSARLDSAALRAVRGWRWTPQTRNGAPISVRGYVTIPFVLV